MARIPDVEIERLKETTDLQALVEAKGVTLVRHGADWHGRCPFHDDKTPSLVVSPAKNLWHCLGACQIGGTAIDWVMRADGVSFRHAVELLRNAARWRRMWCGNRACASWPRRWRPMPMMRRCWRR